jgi:type IV secretory pathway TrbD component
MPPRRHDHHSCLIHQEQQVGGEHQLLVMPEGCVHGMLLAEAQLWLATIVKATFGMRHWYVEMFCSCSSYRYASWQLKSVATQYVGALATHKKYR